MTYESILQELVETDERFVVMTAENRAAIRNLPPKIGNRFIDTGITEQNMIGMAAGLALRGRIPVCHALATFLTLRAFEFIRTDVGISGLPVKLVGAVPGFLSDANGPTHQAIEDVSLLRGIPGMNVWCPADEEDMLIGLRTVLTHDKPFYIRYNNLKPVIEHSKHFEVGKAEVVAEGHDIVFLVYGMLFGETYKAYQLLKDKGFSVGLINLRTVKPLDEAAVLKAVRGAKLTVTVEDHFLTGGLYSILGELFLKHGEMHRVLPLALDSRWFKPVLLKDLLPFEGFTGEQIAQKVGEVMMVSVPA